MSIEKHKVNIREVAKAAGVSITSVSRAMHGGNSNKLSPQKRQHILDICAKMHYYPNEHTRRLFSCRSNTIAIFFPPFGRISEDVVSDYIDINYGTCLMGAYEELSQRGLDLLLTEVTPAFLDSQRYLSMIRGKIIDGILIWGAHEQDEYINEVLKENIPVVMLQTEKNNCRCSVVISDDYNGMKNLTNQVWESGHRNIAIVRPPAGDSTGQLRLKGILDALADHHLQPVYLSSRRGYGYALGRHATAEILQKTPQATCIMASNDMAALGCIDELNAHNFRVPQDISVTGADGLKLPGLKMKLNSFFVPAFKIGQCGAQLLCEALAQPGTRQRILLPVELTSGDSLGKI